MTTSSLPQLLSAFYLERLALLMRHEAVAASVTDYDVNNMYQYVLNREETHVSWLERALQDVGQAVPADPARPTVSAGKGADGWKALAAEDASANGAFVTKWRPQVDALTHARHRKMLQVVLGEMTEHQRLFEQGSAGRHDVIGRSLPINDHPGTVIPTRWVE